MGNDGIMSARGNEPLLWKRSLDLMCILLVAPAVLLLSTAVALLIWLGSPGPILFRQRRVGYKGRLFTCYKFRTTLVKLDARSDPRLIPFGAVLRASGLDELPQILNVLRGEMSLVEMTAVTFVRDRPAHDAGKSAGGIFGKPAAEALTPDNQTAELYDPAVFRRGRRKRWFRQLLRDLWCNILRWLRVRH
jgi:hypothetical protein